jgi:hypothetical protein
MALAKYSFLPWLRQGLAREIIFDEQLEDAPEIRPEVKAQVILQVEGKSISKDSSFELVPEGEIIQDIRIVGPGEVSGVDRRAIVKEEPRPGDVNFEPNYFPYLEFYEEDFPWRYSPVKTDSGRLRPWITLVVLEEGEFEQVNSPDYLLPAIELNAGTDFSTFFPDKFQTWAWAHVHVNKQLLLNIPDSDTEKGNQAANKLFDLIKSNPNCASSRIICPRKLKPNTAYHAFLLPAFEQGRLAGLGKDNATIAAVDIQQASWDNYDGRPTNDTNRWPFYHTWYFRTGEQLDFEYLVRLIEPRDLSVIAPEIGRRPMDLQNSGYLLDYRDENSKGVLPLEGALQLPFADREDFLDTSGADQEEKKQFLQQLKEIINLNEDWKEEETPASYADYKNQLFNHPDDSAVDDPIVVPPLYGNWYFAQKVKQSDGTIIERSFGKNKVEFDVESATPKENWFNQINLDPRYRVAAGMGTQVIQKDQENLMDKAWDQIGEVVEAIKRVRLGQFSLEVSDRLYEKYFKSVDQIKRLGLTSKLHQRLNFVANQSISSAVESSIIPSPIVKQSITKFSRPNGPILKRTNFSFAAPNQDSEPDESTPTNLSANLVSLNASTNLFSFPNLNSSSGVVFDQGNTVDILGESGSFTGNIFTSAVFNGNLWENFDPSIWGDFGGGGNPTVPPFLFFSIDLESENELEEIKDYFEASNWKERSEEENTDTTVLLTDLNTQLAPRKVINQRLWREINLKVSVPFDEDTIDLRSTEDENITLQKPVEPIAYPTFPDPMYIHLQELSKELFLPGIEKIPENTFSLLETNRNFIESFMLGNNHEMARELLWRSYPTDQRGSYFQKFWESIDNPLQDGDVPDIKPIHEWLEAAPPTDEENPNLSVLGANRPGTGPQENRLVLVVRGELLKKFPNTLIYLQKAVWIEKDGQIRRTLIDLPKVGDDHPTDPGVELSAQDVNQIINDQSLIEYPTFQAKVDPDITFLGFNDVSPEDAVGIWPDEADDFIDGGGDITTKPAGYFIVVRERPGEPRFGIDLPNYNDEDLETSFLNLEEWNDLHWDLINAEEGQFIDLLRLIDNGDASDLGSLGDLDASAPLTKPIAADGGPDGEMEQALAWGRNGAHMAGILLQLPFMIAIHASEMISKPA